MKKHMFIFVSLLLVVAVALAACSTAPTATTIPELTEAASTETVTTGVAATAPPVSTDQVEISFWHNYNTDSAEITTLETVLIPEFEAEHPNIKVLSVQVPWPDFLTKLTSALAAGTAPDLMRSDIIWVPQLAEMGAFVALDEAMPDFAEYSALVFPGPLSTNLWKEHYYGLPLDTNTKVWMYNDAMYNAAGIDGAPATLAEVESDCQALKAKYPDAYFYVKDNTNPWNTLPWIWSFGGSITDDAGTTSTGYLNSPETVAAFEYFLKLYDEGCIAPLIMGDGVDEWAGFGTGVYASIDQGPWAYSIEAGQYPDFKFKTAPFPAGPAGSINVVGGEDINLLTQSKHPAEALEFLRFMMSAETQLKLMEVGQISVRSDLLDSDLVKNSDTLGIFLEQLQTSKARTAHPAWSQMETILIDAGQFILRHEKTPQQALDDAAAEIDVLLKE